jgi:hypothetical protein
MVKNAFNRSKAAIGFLIASISIAGLLSEETFAGFLRQLWTWWNNFLRFFLEPFDPCLQSALSLLNPLLPWSIQLSSDWRHYFVLMMLFFSSLTAAYWRHTEHTGDLVKLQSPIGGTINWLVGLASSLLTAVLVTSVPEKFQNDDEVGLALWNFILGLGPVIVIAVFFLWHGVRHWKARAKAEGFSLSKVTISHPVLRAGLGAALIAAFVLIALISGFVGSFHSNIEGIAPLLLVPQPIISVVATLAFGGTLIGWAILTSMHWARGRERTTWRLEFCRNMWAQVGSWIVGVIAAAFVIVLFSAGLGRFNI